jgi:hypothetical protein
MTCAGGLWSNASRRFGVASLLVMAFIVACGTSTSTSSGDGAAASGDPRVPSQTPRDGGADASVPSPDATSPGGEVVTPCTKGGSDCKNGDVCTDIGRATAVCRPACTSDATCASAKAGCVILTAGPPETGACIPTCSPYGAECPAGFTCSRVAEQVGVTQVSKLAFCKPVGATPLGGLCADAPTSCGPNADCIYIQEPPQNETAADSKCHTLCDDGHQCGTKGTCFTQAGQSFGFCSSG